MEVISSGHGRPPTYSHIQILQVEVNLLIKELPDSFNFVLGLGDVDDQFPEFVFKHGYSINK